MNIAPNVRTLAIGPLVLTRSDARKMLFASVPAVLGLLAVIVATTYMVVTANSAYSAAKNQLNEQTAAAAALTATNAEADRLQSTLTTLQAHRSASLSGMVTLASLLRSLPLRNVRLTSATVNADNSVTLEGEARTPSGVASALSHVKGLTLNTITNNSQGIFAWTGSYR